MVSIKSRFFASLAANVSRAGVSFFTGLLVARSLSPIGYGDLFFLLGSFTAVRAFIDMGTSNAFYTFISRRARNRQFYLVYLSWIAIQFVLTCLIIAIILPSTMIDRIWLGYSRDVILVSFFASFMQLQVWGTISQICEAVRKTILIQVAGLSVVVVHLIVVLTLIWTDLISIEAVLVVLIGEYSLAAIIIWRLLSFNREELFHVEESEEFNLKQVLGEYWIFCRPLMIAAFLSFIYIFVDRWLLQRFGGSEQQGFYQISVQFAAVSLLATASILNIFWKEIAEACEKNDHQKVQRLNQKVSRGLLMLGATISCFLVPWSEQITLLLLGDAYAAGWVVLAVMFLYPIHQSMGQINAAVFMAYERTTPYMYISIIGMFVGIPVSYILLVPSNEWIVSGFGLGALGLAIKMLGLNVLFVNNQSWFLARYHKWKYDWLYQFEGIAFLLLLGFAVKKLSELLVSEDLLSDLGLTSSIIMITLSAIVYLFGVAIYIWFRPSLFGLERSEVLQFLRRATRTKKLIV